MMHEHAFVVVDVAMIRRQFLGIHVGDRNLRHKTDHHEPGRLERAPSRRRHMDAIRADRDDIANVQFVGEQITFPSNRSQRVVAVEDGAVFATVFHPQFPFIAL